MISSNVTEHQYKTSLKSLMKVAIEQNSTASETAAEIVLSLNNGGTWKLNLCGLHSLDHSNIIAAKQCIAGKLKFGTEPDYLFMGADEIILELKNKYKHLKVKK